MLVLVANEKGGTGKTMLAVNLAVMRARSGRKVLLLDTDRQGSALMWAGVREQAGIDPVIDSIQKFGASLRHDILELEKKYDDIVLDAGGRDNPELRASMVAADFLVIPFRPSQFDVWSLDSMSGLLTEARTINPGIKSLAVINLASPHPGVNEAELALSYLDEVSGLAPARTIVHERIAFRRAAQNGLSVVELKPEDRLASSEVRSLYHEVFDGEKEI